MKILIVDDSKPIFMMVNQMLKELGHEGVWAENGKQALNFIDENNDFTLVLLDWNMPIMDGLEFLKENSFSNKYTCPIVMMTTENKSDKIRLALENGAIDFIMKPFTTDILKNKIEMVCSYE